MTSNRLGLIRADPRITFLTLSRTGGIKPGAVVLSEVSDPAGNRTPALVAQQFGKGRVAALLIGDLWRWGLRRADPGVNDLDRSWRQTVRWLVADVPGRVDVSVRPKTDATAPAVELRVQVRDAEYRPLDNAKVALRITLPNGEILALDAEPDGREAGTYAATYVTKQPGAYRFVASLSARDAPITEPWISPLWHQPIYFLIAIACLSAEWGLRRVNGLA